MIENDLDPMEPGKTAEVLTAEIAAAGAIIAGVVEADIEDAAETQPPKEAKNTAAEVAQAIVVETPLKEDVEQDEALDSSAEELKVPIPDDPGIDPDEKPEEDRRFRLF